MLFSIDRNHYIDEIPYESDFRRWRARLTSDEFEAIADELKRRIDGGEIHTSSWIPGNDWNGTVYEPIYTKSCDMNPSESGNALVCFCGSCCKSTRTLGHSAVMRKMVFKLMASPILF